MFSLNSMISLHSLALDLSRYFSLWNNLFFKNLSFVYCWYSFYFTCYFFVDFFLMCSFPHWLLLFIHEHWGYVQLQFLLHSKFKYYTSNSFSNSSSAKGTYMQNLSCDRWSSDLNKGNACKTMGNIPQSKTLLNLHSQLKAYILKHGTTRIYPNPPEFTKIQPSPPRKDPNPTDYPQIHLILSIIWITFAHDIPSDHYLFIMAIILSFITPIYHKCIFWESGGREENRIFLFISCIKTHN